MKNSFRFVNPRQLDHGDISATIAEEGEVRIRFDEPGYEPALLAELDQLCQIHGPALRVSFTGHHFVKKGFDGTTLRHLPHVSSLTINCQRAQAIAEVARLHLERLELDVFELEQVDLFSRIPLDRLTDLTIGNTRRGKIDLTPLSACTKLERLSLEQQTKGLASLAGLPELREVKLRSIPKTQSLDVLSQLPSLTRLGIGLGGRENIDEIHSPTLEKLSIGGVLGFNSLGDLSRFPSLQILIVDGQPKLQSIDLAQAPAGLRVLNLFTCKSLDSIGDLTRFHKLEDLALVQTALDLDGILESSLPDSLRSARFSTRKAAKDRELRSQLDHRGYREFPERAEY